ncbi:hypothetical protein GCM10010492_53470 [Saccharothrix mutabilis subsp. mutabilis]|uniref:Uncharacterized protein n=1 Tax=Saccharothrix mutabilis subsp. mutabilis TaxID=66855 RepID=A0ABP3DYN9_9PSEU
MEEAIGICLPLQIFSAGVHKGRKESIMTGSVITCRRLATRWGHPQRRSAKPLTSIVAALLTEDPATNGPRPGWRSVRKSVTRPVVALAAPTRETRPPPPDRTQAAHDRPAHLVSRACGLGHRDPTCDSIPAPVAEVTYFCSHTEVHPTAEGHRVIASAGVAAAGR